jgi:uroporphyrinogen III methyltransferase/synthase
MNGSSKHLRGLRIALTRSTADNGRWAPELRERGAEPIDWPCIETRTLTESAEALRSQFDRADWVAVASRNALSALVELAPELELAEKRWACVGQGTARAARDAGACEPLVSREGTAESLAQDLLERLEDRQRVLLLRARDGRPDFAEAFATAGRSLDELALYETLHRAPGPPCDLPDLDAVFFASPSAVQAFFESGTLGGERPDTSPLLFSIGPSTTAALSQHGQTVAGEAATRDLAGLCNALVTALGTRPISTEPKP